MATVANPSILTVAKSSLNDNFDEILQAKPTLGKFLKENLYKRLTFKYFVKSNLLVILKLLSTIS